jgi:hypothetical protein
MKFRFSKITISLALITGCGALNSCRLFGDNKYASQTEVETEVPESLEQGKPTAGPAAVNEGAIAINDGVPPSSNLTEIPTPYGSAIELPASPGSPSSVTSVTPGGASLTGLPPDRSRDLIDIPKPDFGTVSVHNTRPPAEMLSLGPPLKPVTRMSLGLNPGAGPSTAGVIQEKVQPLAPTTDKSSDAEIASAPKAVKSIPSSEPGVPMLLGSARLSDFYQSLHQPLLESAVVENIPADSAPPASADELAVPPPPPADDSAGPPPGQ